jgi:IS30 family transposase
MPGYTHLTRSERDQIADLKARGLGPSAIARAIGRHPSTLSRELKRNAHEDGTYRPVFAEGSYRFRRQRAAILERDRTLSRFVIDRLAPSRQIWLGQIACRAMEGWTPEQIAGWLKRGVEVGLRAISTETIYAFIFRGAQKAEKLWRQLPRRKASRGRRARRSRDKITDKVHISQRSEAANDRPVPSHWGADLVIH